MAHIHSGIEVYHDDAPEVNPKQQPPLHQVVPKDVSSISQQHTVLGSAHASEPIVKPTLFGITSRKRLFILAIVVGALLGAGVGGGVAAGVLGNNSGATSDKPGGDAASATTTELTSSTGAPTASPSRGATPTALDCPGIDGKTETFTQGDWSYTFLYHCQRDSTGPDEVLRMMAATVHDCADACAKRNTDRKSANSCKSATWSVGSASDSNCVLKSGTEVGIKECGCDDTVTAILEP